MRLAFVNTRMPGINTFLIRDLRALLRVGVPIDLYLVDLQGLDPGFRRDLEAAGGSVDRIPFPFGPGVAATLFSEMIHHPIRLAVSLAIGLSTLLRSPGEGIRALAVLPAAMALGRRLARKSAEAGPIAVHALWAGVPATVAFWIARHHGFDYSFSAHAWDLLRRTRMLDRKLGAARGLVVCSAFAARQAASRVSKEHASKIHLVHHGLDLREWHFEACGARPAKPILYAVGRLTPKKGFDDLIEACAILTRAGRDFECRIAGPDGGQGAALRRQVERLDLGVRVRFEGPRVPAEIRLGMREADLLVCPSVQSGLSSDGIPNVVLEAMAAGTPVVATDAGGLAEVIVPGRTGRRAEQRNPRGLARALREALDDWETTTRLAVKARKLIEEQFETQRTSEEFLQAIGLASIAATSGGSDETIAYDFAR